MGGVQTPGLCIRIEVPLLALVVAACSPQGGENVSCLNPSGTITLLTASLDDPSSIASSARGIAWIERGAGDDGKVSLKPHCEGEVTVIHQAYGAETVAFDGNDLYFAVAGEAWMANGRILVALSNTVVPTVVLENLEGPRRLQVDDRNLYWLDIESTLYRSEKSGEEVAAITSSVAGYARDGSWLYLLKGTGVLERRTKLGSDPVVLATVDTSPGFIASGMAVDETHVYFTVYGGTGVRRVPIVGGPVEVVVAGEPGTPAWYAPILVDAGRLYWRDYDGTISSAMITGGDPEIIPAVRAARLATYSGVLYWSEASSPGAARDGRIQAMIR